MWRMEKDHPESNVDFPFAIIQKGQVLRWSNWNGMRGLLRRRKGGFPVWK